MFSFEKDLFFYTSRYHNEDRNPCVFDYLEYAWPDGYGRYTLTHGLYKGVDGAGMTILLDHMTATTDEWP